MRIAFYAPLKPPTSTVPSGDRMIARMFIRALEMKGHDVTLASRLRTYDDGNIPGRQQRLHDLGERVADRLIKRYRSMAIEDRPTLWFSYHLYHKAPDWIGPKVASALAIPYVIAEASHAPKQAEGKWSLGHHAVTKTLGLADLVIGLNSTDETGVLPNLTDTCQYVHMKPFIGTAPFTAAFGKRQSHRAELAEQLQIAPQPPIILCAAMMRAGNKLASFQLLAEAMTKLGHLQWNLVIAGGGVAEADVRAAFAPLGSRVHWLGLLDQSTLPAAYAAADMFVWPAIDEPLGMCFLEAQAAGTPVIGGRVRGVPDLICHDKTGMLTTEGDVDELCAALTHLLTDHGKCRVMGENARTYAMANHDIEIASQQLDALLEALV